MAAPTPKPPLTCEALCAAAQEFARIESEYPEPSLYGVTDGKAVGTYVEQKFRTYLHARFTFEEGNSAKGIDIPSLGVDLKVTSKKQPQSSSPFRSARQKIFGLGYDLLVFVYDKIDDAETGTARLDILHVIFVQSVRTADYQTTTGLRKLLDNDANAEDLVAYMRERNLPLDYDIEAPAIAEEILKTPPEVGYLTISNALQWRLQYQRVIDKAGDIDGIVRVFGKEA